MLLAAVLFTAAVLTSSHFFPLESCVSVPGWVRLPFHPSEVLSEIAIPEMCRRGTSVGGKGKSSVQNEGITVGKVLY